MTILRIGLIGDFNPTVTAHQAIPMALRFAAQGVGRTLESTWVHTATLGRDTSQQLSVFAALWCVPASPYENEEGALAAIRFARESGRPYLGTCGGFQHALLEYAHNVLGLRDAEHAETRPDAAMPLIAPLSCALVEQTGTIVFEEGSRLRTIYGAAEAEEEYHCRYGLNPRYEKVLDGTALRICGRDRTGEVRAVELSGHPFFIATLFQPERAALRGCSHPLVAAYVAAAASCSESGIVEHHDRREVRERAMTGPDDTDPAVRARGATEFFGPRVPGQLGCVFDHSATELVVGHIDVTANLIAGTGFLFAPAVIALADTCAAIGCGNNIPAGSSFTTIELKTNFLSSARVGERVTCRCTPVHLGRQTHVWDATVTNETTGRTMALFRCTQMVLPPR